MSGELQQRGWRQRRGEAPGGSHAAAPQTCSTLPPPPAPPALTAAASKRPGQARPPHSSRGRPPAGLSTPLMRAFSASCAAPGALCGSQTPFSGTHILEARTRRPQARPASTAALRRRLPSTRLQGGNGDSARGMCLGAACNIAWRATVHAKAHGVLQCAHHTECRRPAAPATAAPGAPVLATRAIRNNLDALTLFNQRGCFLQMPVDLRSAVPVSSPRVVPAARCRPPSPAARVPAGMLARGFPRLLLSLIVPASPSVGHGRLVLESQRRFHTD